MNMSILEKVKNLDWLAMLKVTACISLCFAEGFQMSLNGPFYPEEAIQKHLDQTKIGLATGSQYLARLFGSIIILMVVNIRNQRFILIAGAITAGLTSVVFALLTYIPGVWPFFFLSTLLRFMTGLFSAGIWGTGFSVMTSIYPSSEGLIVGLIETAYGAGQMIGPVLGNVLFRWKGFSMPFDFAGALECILAVICIFATSGIYKGDKKSYSPVNSDRSHGSITNPKINRSVFLYLIKPQVILASLPITTVYSTVGFVSVALGPYLLMHYGYGSSSNGKFFLAIFGTATIASPLFGYLIDRGFCGKIYLLSICTGALGYFLLFLPQVFEPTRHIGVLYTALILIGISAAAAYTGSYLISEKAALIMGTIDEAEVRLYVLNGVSFWASIGITSGQVLTGGLIYNETNFNYACLAQCLSITLAGIPSVIWMWRNNLIGQIYYHNPMDIPEMVAFASAAQGSRSRHQTSSGSFQYSINALVSSSLTYN